MNFITQMLTQQLAGNAISQISNKLGVSPAVASGAVAIAVPMLISALARNSSTPQGAQALNDAVARDHDGSVLDNLESYLGNTESGNGAAILGHVFGGQQGSVENALAERTGLDANSAGQLLQTMAPLVMGALGKTQQQQGLDAQGLSEFLGDQHQQTQAAAPDLVGML